MEVLLRGNKTRTAFSQKPLGGWRPPFAVGAAGQPFRAFGVQRVHRGAMRRKIELFPLCVKSYKVTARARSGCMGRAVRPVRVATRGTSTDGSRCSGGSTEQLAIRAQGSYHRFAFHFGTDKPNILLLEANKPNETRTDTALPGEYTRL